MEDRDIDDSMVAERAAHHGLAKFREVQDIYAGLKHELEGDKFWRYQRQVSPGLQEYIEALSFAHYLEHGTLITFNEVQETLVDPQGVPVRILNHISFIRHVCIHTELYFPLILFGIYCP